MQPIRWGTNSLHDVWPKSRLPADLLQIVRRSHRKLSVEDPLRGCDTRTPIPDSYIGSQTGTKACIKICRHFLTWGASRTAPITAGSNDSSPQFGGASPILTTTKSSEGTT